jgi:predicted negative regulator of RcsB-dependent stress response
MKRIEFFILTGLSSLVVLLLIGHIFLVRQAAFEQNRLSVAQQIVTEGQTAQNNLKQVAIRIYQDSQKTQDQALKDLMTRQQISFKPTESATSAPADTTTAPTTTH